MRAGRAELALIGVTVIWGATFVVVKSALADISTFLFLALRFSLAAIALALVYRNRMRWQSVAPGIGAGALLFVAYVFQTKGLEFTTPSKSAFLTGLSIPMVPLLSSLVYRNRPRLFEVAGVLIASSGMAVMTLPAGKFEMGNGDLLSCLCAVAFALHIVVVSHYSPMIGFETIAVIQVATAALLGIGTFRFAEPLRFHLNAAVATSVLVTGLLATALAFTTMAWAQQYTSATRAALIFALEPVVAWFTSYLMTGETMSGRGKVGAGLILAGVLLVELRRGGAETNATRETSNT
ncbi:MAG TPA: DMT family transporter [Bryobacteraceae bacterium]|nr:DMT family transporter [Bryobacteraceae bacterium]